MISIAAPITPDRPHVRRIGIADLRWALARGWTDFLSLQGVTAFAALLYPAAGLITLFFVQRAALAPLLFPLFAGLALLGPALSVGFYDIARRRGLGEPVDFRTFFAAYSGARLRRLLPILTLLAALFGLWIASAVALHWANLGSMTPRTTLDFARDLFTTRAGWSLIITGNLAGAAFAVTALAIGLVSVPMLVDGPAGTGRAIATSLAATWRNPGPVLAWGALVALLTLLGAAFLLVGPAVSFPVLGYATWHLHTRLIEG